MPNVKTQILKTIGFVLLLFTIQLSLFTFLVQPTFAANCPSGVFGRHYNDAGKPNPGATLNGVSCTSPGNYLEAPCALPTGRILKATYCMAKNDPIYPDGNLNNPVPLDTKATLTDQEGCIETYQQEVPPGQAPSLCDRGKEAPTEIGKIFGQIIPPPEIQRFGFGATGISKFLSNLVTLIYSLAAVVLVLMLIWGAWDWLTSEGDKEKLESAKRKLINAAIGILLFAVAFAVIQVLGTFTGFTFFKGQK